MEIYDFLVFIKDHLRVLPLATNVSDKQLGNVVHSKGF